ncbi:VOC family protein [Sinomonas sp. ASV322]|uniref:VOC family protein n=1 Tax=Sinomonas sp. ASV322 TaxID=3041920 RepID=UPI0027DBE36E|nr:VOC family protein [Sinomonas sp. ASV322]MDQ4503742.1 VOC family protein [Sinomonas sp. ASV322]
MAYDIQIVVDSRDPHAQADWWAETLGWAVEPSNEEFIRRMIAEGFATEEETMVYHGMLVWASAQAIAPEDELDRKDRRRILFQVVPEGKAVKNRVHWDVRLAGDDKDVIRAKLEARGATFLWEAAEGPHSWYTMADPEGNEFCIS